MSHYETKPTILVVDDDPISLELIKMILTEEYTVIIATSGHSALTIANSGHPPSLILLDVLMPDMDGYEVLKQLKEEYQTAQVPVIFVSAQSDDLDELRGLNLGAVDYITKPISSAILKMRVGNQLKIIEQRKTLEAMGHIDQVTQIANRRHFDFMVDNEWGRTRRANLTLSLALISIDHLKWYTEQHGHTKSNHLLTEIASLLCDSIQRGGDFAARSGDDTLLLLLPETDAAGGQALLETIQKKVTSLIASFPEPTNGNGSSFSVGGVTVKPNTSYSMISPAEAVDQATLMLFQAKDAGDNRILWSER